MNMRIKRAGINLCLMILAFTIQNCVFPLMPFLTATPNLLLIQTFSFGFIEGKQAGMFYGVLAGILLDLFYSGPFGFYTLFYIYVGYLNGICTKYYYEDYITLPLKPGQRTGIQSVHLCVPFSDPRKTEYSVLFKRTDDPRDHFYCCDHFVSLPPDPVYQPVAETYGK